MIDSIVGIASKNFGSVVDNNQEIFKSLNEIIPKSGVNIPARNYGALMIFMTVIGYVIGLILLIFLLATVWHPNIFTMIGAILFVPIAVGMSVFLMSYFVPYNQMTTRKTSIDTNLPFAVAHMGYIATSGIPPSAIFKLLADFSEYDALAVEMGKIVRNMDMFGMDPMSSIREVAKRSPSEKLKQILLGFVSTIESGGDLKTYLKIMGEQALFEWRTKRQKYLQQLDTYAEFYTGLLIAAPLFIISLFSVMNMIESNLGGVGILQLMKLSIYILVPALNIGFMLFLHSTQVEM